MGLYVSQKRDKLGLNQVGLQKDLIRPVHSFTRFDVFISHRQHFIANCGNVTVFTLFHLVSFSPSLPPSLLIIVEGIRRQNKQQETENQPDKVTLSIIKMHTLTRIQAHNKCECLELSICFVTLFVCVCAYLAFLGPQSPSINIFVVCVERGLHRF